MATHRWLASFESAKEFYNEHGHLDAPVSSSLHQWLAYQKRNPMTDYQQGLLETIGLAKIGRHQKRWDSHYETLREYHQQHGDCKVPARYHDQQLFHWVRRQRQQHSNMMKGRCPMPLDRIEKLDQLRFDWYKTARKGAKATKETDEKGRSKYPEQQVGQGMVARANLEEQDSGLDMSQHAAKNTNTDSEEDSLKAKPGGAEKHVGKERTRESSFEEQQPCQSRERKADKLQIANLDKQVLDLTNQLKIEKIRSKKALKSLEDMVCQTKSRLRTQVDEAQNERVEELENGEVRMERPVAGLLEDLEQEESNSKDSGSSMQAMLCRAKEQIGEGTAREASLKRQVSKLEEKLEAESQADNLLDNYAKARSSETFFLASYLPMVDDSNILMRIAQSLDDRLTKARTQQESDGCSSQLLLRQLRQWQLENQLQPDQNTLVTVVQNINKELSKKEDEMLAASTGRRMENAIVVDDESPNKRVKLEASFD